MKKTFQFLLNLINILYKILPFFIGIYCYYPVFMRQEEHIYPFLDAIYSSIMLYSGEIESSIDINELLLLQFARFLALAVTLSVLINAFNKMNSIVNYIKLFHRDSTIVYGNSNYANYLYENLNKGLRIRGEENKFIKNASRYILMFSSDAENLAFYNQYYEYLKDKRVYIMLDNVSRQNIENHLITVFSIVENCARQYWKNNPVEKSEKIAIVGFGNTGENILLYGLQVNLIDPDKRFEYHIYGNGTQFRREHTELDKMTPDEIIFHDNGTYEFAEMQGYDRIIICDGMEDSNIITISRLLAFAPVNCKVYLYAPNGNIITNLLGNNRITCFGTAAEAASTDIILNEKLMEDARRQHEFYFKKYGGTPWEKLDCFKRYSNVSSSDYMYMAEHLLKSGMSFETLAELEHIRWCRYHYIHNWKYGKITDSIKRTHNCLIPFSELSEEEKIKDIEAIKSKMHND